MKFSAKCMIAAILVLLLCCTGLGLAVEITITKTNGDVETITDIVTDANTGTDTNTDISTIAREAFIEAIIDTAKTLYEKANGRWQRAQYAGDIYVCKNFTVHLFLQNADRFRMTAYPNVELNIPRLNKETDDGYYKGIVWEDLSESEGNPFYAAAQFRYNSNLSMEENKEIARQLMTQVERGDYFQMQASYYWGNGAHSLVFIENYDPESQTVHWTDSNMKTKKVDGINYGLVQFDAQKDIGWFVDAFCHPKRGATLYRLRDDIVYADGRE